MRLIVAAAAALSLLGGTAVAQIGFNGLVGGQVATAVGALMFGGSCYVGRGFSTFQRTYTNGLGGTKVLISFSELFDSAKYDLSGQAILTFANATAGDIRFKQAFSPGAIPSTVLDPQFINYSETYNGLQLTLRFSIQFPDCTLPITAVFDAT